MNANPKLYDAGKPRALILDLDQVSIHQISSKSQLQTERQQKYLQRKKKPLKSNYEQEVFVCT